MKIGEAIKRIRKSEKMNQGQLAKSIGITQAYLSGIETGNKNPSLEVLENLAKSLDVPLPVLFWFSVERDDCHPEKRYIFDMLKPSIDNLMEDIFV